MMKEGDDKRGVLQREEMGEEEGRRRYHFINQLPVKEKDFLQHCRVYRKSMGFTQVQIFDGQNNIVDYAYGYTNF